MVTLIGLAAKNAILIVEFAVLKRQEGMSAGEAALEAARLRFRPIVMTSLAFILGVVPLAIRRAPALQAATRSAQASSAACWRQPSSRPSSSRCSTS
jgi:multidrug efflux pump subunit AcrB